MEEEVEERNNSSSGISAQLRRSCFAMTVRSLESSGRRKRPAAWRHSMIQKKKTVAAWRHHRGTNVSGERNIRGVGGARAGTLSGARGEAGRVLATPDRVAGSAVIGERPRSGTPAGVSVRPWGRTDRPHGGDGEGGHRHHSPS